MQSVKYLLGTTALAGAMLASATVQANECVSDKLLSNVEGYISSARDDAGEARWQRALDTLNGNISWIEGTDINGVQTDGYWTGVTLAEASLNADLRKESRWVPIKTAIHCMLRAGTYGVAQAKPWYEQWGAWGNLSATLQTKVGELDGPEYHVEWNTPDGTYSKFAELPPVEVGSSTSYKFTAGIGVFDVQSLNARYSSFSDLELELNYKHGNGQWDAVLNGMGKGSQGSYDIGRTFNDLQWKNGAMAATSADGNGVNGAGDSLLTGQFYRRDTSMGMITINGKEHTQYPYRIAGGVITPDLAATYMTESVIIPDNPN